MNKFASKAIALLIFATLSVPALFAQRGAPQFPEFHYLTLSFGGGYSSIFSNLDDAPAVLSGSYSAGTSGMTVPGGGGATIGIGYEYCYRALWLSLGVEGQLITSSIKGSIDSLFVPGMMDTEGDPYTHIYVTDRWRDNQMAAYLNIPFMIGFNSGGFYAGVGAKVGMSVYGQAVSKMQYHSDGRYDQFIEDFEKMPNHFFTDYEAAPENNGKPTKISFKPNVALIAELGYELYSAEATKKVLPWRLKLGVYGEYGFMNILPDNPGRSMMDFSVAPDGQQNPAQLVTNPYYLTSGMYKMNNDGTYKTDGGGNNISAVGNPFHVGVKLTFMFELPVPQKCNCLQDSRGASWRNNAPKVTKRQKKNTERATQDKKDKE